MTVYEADIPGVGKKFELELDDEERLVVVTHHDGKREVYFRPSEDADSQRLFGLTSTQARELGAILEGTYFQPVALDEIQVPLGESLIEWTKVEDESPLVGETLRKTNIRKQTGVSVIAVQRGEQTFANPDPDFAIEVGDIIVTLGTRDQHAEFKRLFVSSDSDSESAT